MGGGGCKYPQHFPGEKGAERLQPADERDANRLKTVPCEMSCATLHLDATENIHFLTAWLR